MFSNKTNKKIILNQNYSLFINKMKGETLNIYVVMYENSLCFDKIGILASTRRVYVQEPPVLPKFQLLSLPSNVNN